MKLFSLLCLLICSKCYAQEQWPLHGGDAGEQRYSTLTQIKPSNVQQLGLSWWFDMQSKRGLEATPLVINGVMYITSTWSRVFALNAKTGELLWQYNPQVPGQWARNLCCDVVNRGVAHWQGKIFVGTIDGRLIALDAATGAEIWQTLTIDPSRPYTITGAPRAYNGKVFMGNGGGEFGVRGYVGAFDANTGKQLWRFYTVPGDPEQPFEHAEMAQAAKTWAGGKWWQVGGGGTVWDSMAYDAQLNLLYIGVGNGTPWSRHLRSPGGGDNLFLSSIVALNPDTGKMIWHYQTTPGDSWDYTATQHMILADLKIQGQHRKVIMQAPKNGFFYVLDRTTGEFLSAQNYIRMNWASHVDQTTGRPVETGVANWKDESKLVMPADIGGHNWNPMSYNPNTGLVYIPTNETIFPYTPDTKLEHIPGAQNHGLDLVAMMAAVADLPDIKFCSPGHLTAWDPVKQQQVWRVKYALAGNGGTLSTASNIVFQGTADGRIIAYDAQDGDLLWQSEIGIGVIAPPITYQIDGEQYLAVLAGWGGGIGLFGINHPIDYENSGRLLVYKLNAKTKLPIVNKVTHKRSAIAALTTQEQSRSKQGEALYSEHCTRCHGGFVKSAGVIKDLRYMPAEHHQYWQEIVRGGVYSGLGMPSFADLISESEALALQAYVKQQTLLPEPWWQDLLDHACLPAHWLAD